MTRSDLIDMVAHENKSMPKYRVQTIVTYFFDVMSKTLQNGKNIELRGLGSFHLRARKAREGTNPHTGQKIHISARKALLFRSGKRLRLRTNQGMREDSEYWDHKYS